MPFVARRNVWRTNEVVEDVNAQVELESADDVHEWIPVLFGCARQASLSQFLLLRSVVPEMSRPAVPAIIHGVPRHSSGSATHGGSALCYHAPARPPLPLR